MKGIKHIGEAQRRTEEMRRQMSNKAGYKSGGRVAAYDAGAATGKGRMEKAEQYGGNARKK